MSENVEQLRATLQELHEELESITDLDDQARDMLREAAGQIQEALSQHDTVSLGEDDSLSEQLADSARGFQQSHPTLARLIGNVLDALGQIGI